MNCYYKIGKIILYFLKLYFFYTYPPKLSKCTLNPPKLLPICNTCPLKL